MKKKLPSAAVLLLAAMLLTACGAPTSDSLQEETVTIDAAKPDDSGATNAAPEVADPAPVGEDAALAIGSAASINDFALNVTGIEFKKSVDSSAYTAFEADEGNQFLLVSVYVENNAKTAQTFLPSFGLNDEINAKVIYGDGFEYSSTQLLAYDKDLHDSHLNPLTSKSGVIAFQVPNQVVSSADPLSIEFLSGSESVTYSLR